MLCHLRIGVFIASPFGGREVAMNFFFWTIGSKFQPSLTSPKQRPKSVQLVIMSTRLVASAMSPLLRRGGPNSIHSLSVRMGCIVPCNRSIHSSIQRRSDAIFVVSLQKSKHTHHPASRYSRQQSTDSIFIQPRKHETSRTNHQVLSLS